jgi:ribonuclease P protein component
MSAPSPVRGRRLTRSAEFERVYRQGRSLANRHFVLYCFANPASERPRLGLSVSRKVGGAVQRNHVKRLLREAFAQAQEELVAHHDLVVVARPGSYELAEHGGLAAVSASLNELIDRGKLREATAKDGPAAARHGPPPEPAGGSEETAGERLSLALTPESATESEAVVEHGGRQAGEPQLPAAEATHP